MNTQLQDSATDANSGHKKIIPPIWLVVASAIAGVWSTVLMFMGALMSGTTSDEPAHAQRLTGFLKDGWYLYPSQIANGEPRANVGDEYVYGPIAALFGHFFVWLSGEKFTAAVPESLNAYLARHVSYSVIALIGAVALGALLWRALGSWKWGVLGAALLMSTPLWLGHGMFNPKDTPTATAFTIWSLGLFLLIESGEQRKLKQNLWAISCLAIGVILGVGTRPGMWTGYVLSAFIALVYVLFRERNTPATRSQQGWQLFRNVTVGFISGYLVLVSVYPKAFINPFALMIGSFSESSQYEVWQGNTLFLGSFSNSDETPWYYILVWLVASMPVIFLLAGMSAFALHLRMRKTSSRVESDSGRSSALTVLLAQFLGMSLAATIMGSILYHGLRQMLFMIPAIVGLTTIAIWKIWEVASKWSWPRWTQVATVAVIPVHLASMLLVQSQLFPYSYAYSSEIASLGKIDNNWTIDYWRAALRELIRELPQGETSFCNPLMPPIEGSGNPENTELSMYPYINARSCDSLPGFAQLEKTMVGDIELSEGYDYFIAKTSSLGTAMPPNCREISRVSRTNYWQDVTIGQIGECYTTFTKITPGMLVEVGPNKSTRYFIDKDWANTTKTGLSYSTLENPRIGIQVPKGKTRFGWKITLSLSRYVPEGETRTLEVTVAGKTLKQVTFTGDSKQTKAVEFVVPPELLTGAHPENILITLNCPDIASVPDGANSIPVSALFTGIFVDLAEKN